MADLKMGVIETRFAEIIWDREPMTSGELVKICASELEWKKSTTYTVLKKLCDRGIFTNENGTVRSLLSKDEYYAAQSRQFVEEQFQGSLPAFISAFSAGRRLSREEADKIRELLDNWKGSEEES